jgi:hypothetical protein
VYTRVLSPLFKKHEKELLNLVENIKSSADEAGKAAMEKASEAASSDNIMKAASMA